MVQIRRAIIVQLSGLIIVAIALFFLSRVFPIVDILAAVQQRVMQWGAWSAICYPLLYACCNVLLLPGGVLSIGAGFFFGLWWGFLIALLGNVAGAAISFFISRWIGRQWLKRKLLRNRTLVALEPAVEREGLEDHSSQPAASSLPNKSAELSLWSDPNSVSNLHALGRDRAGSGFISLLLPGNTWSIGLEPRAGQDSSASDRVSCLAGWVCERGACSGFARANSAATASRGRTGRGRSKATGVEPAGMILC